MQPKYWHGVLLCVIATVAWGGMFPVMNAALPHIDPFTFTCIRYSVAGLAFVAVLLMREGRGSFNLRGERVGLAWLFGTAGFAGFQFLVFMGQKLAGPEGVLIASIMMVTQPMLGFLVNWVVRRAAPPVGVLGFILLSFTGILLVITRGNIAQLVSTPQNFTADGLILAGALCWVIYTVGAAFFPQWSPYRYTTITTGLGLTSAFGFTAVILLAGFIQLPSAQTLITVSPEIAYMGIVAGFIGVLCWNHGNKILTPLNGVLFMDVVPITAFSISAIQGIVPAPIQVAGAVTSATALVLNNLYLRHRMAAPAAPVSVAEEPKLVAAGRQGADRSVT
jgi:drug/metabolite transporter (DMT)-like permease